MPLPTPLLEDLIDLADLMPESSYPIEKLIYVGNIYSQGISVHKKNPDPFFLLLILLDT